MQTEEYLRKLFDVDRDTIRKWRDEFSEYLSPSAIQKGKTRTYAESDIRVFALINEHWEENPDYENIRIKLNSGEQDDDHYFELVYLSTPVFKETVPDDVDGPVNWGVMLDGTALDEPILVPRAYRDAGDILVSEALSYDESPGELVYPIFYTYRHSIELYLKILVDYEYDPNDKDPHSLAKHIEAIKKKYRKNINPWLIDFLNKFDEIDKAGTSFRYSGTMPQRITEWWVDLRHLRTAMGFLCWQFEYYIRNREIS